MLEAFYLNTFFLFIQILISLFLIWLCDREDEDDDENDIFVKSYFKNKEKFVKTKIFKSKDGFLKGVEIIIEDNKHKKDFEVSY